jgi:mRNA interferase RelE/StbE
VTTFNVRVKKSAAKEIARLHPNVQKRVREAIDGLKTAPFPVGVKKLKGRPGYRIEVADDYRILYDVDYGLVSIEVFKVGHRREVYE